MTKLLSERIKDLHLRPNAPYPSEQLRAKQAEKEAPEVFSSLKNIENAFTSSLVSKKKEWLNKMVAENAPMQGIDLAKKRIDLLEDEIRNPSLPEMSAGEYYKYVSRKLSDPKKAADHFNSLGIPGIRYLDGGSRSAGQGPSNFVVFDPDMIRILERNGQPTGLEPWKPGEYRLGDLLK